MKERLEEGLAYLRAGRLAEAEAIFASVLEADSGCADAWHFVGLIALGRGDAVAASAKFGRAIGLKPDTGVYHFNLGVAQRRLGNVQAALGSYREAVRLSPELAEAHNNLGNILRETGDYTEAAASFRRALMVRPTYAEAQVNLGSALESAGRHDDAIVCYRRALAMAPELSYAHYNLGLALLGRGDFAEAISALRRNIELRPDHAGGWNNLAVAYLASRRFADARAAYLEGLRVAERTNDIQAWRTLLSLPLYDAASDAAERWVAHETFGRAVRDAAGSSKPEFGNATDPVRRLRIGYVTSDFYWHPVGRNMLPLLEHRDRSRFEVVVYAESVPTDATATKLKSMVDVWRPTNGIDDAALVQQIRQDQVDVLVLLAGHFDRNRAYVAAWRPAPVQVNFHDPSTSGLQEIDYLLADRTLVPRRTQEKFSERVVALPSFYIHSPVEDAPPVAPLPVVSRGFITFGSFNSPQKVNDHVLALWAEILRVVPDARLTLKFRGSYASPDLQDGVRGEFARLGIDPSRIDMAAGNDALGHHLARYHDIDIALDPFPFTGSTTSFEALWMGVPVVTLLGDAMVGRWTASMLRALNLDDLVARTPEQYVAIARSLARDIERLAALRGGLRASVAASPLCDGRRRARQVERIYRALWTRWRKSSC